MSTNLNPNYLRTDTAKQLLNASYQLEELTNKFPIDRIISYKTDKQTEIPKTNKEKFVEIVRQGVKEMPNVIKKAKRKLRLDRETKFPGLKGENKLKRYINKNSTEIGNEPEL